MENWTDTSILSRPELTSADGNKSNDDEGPEESSWTMYFEDFFKASNAAAAADCDSTTEDDDCDRRPHNDSSLVSDAASFVGMKKINVPKEPSKPKKRKCTEVLLVGRHDLEDTASSPSRSPNNVCGMINLLGNNTRDKAAGGTSHEKEDISGQDEGGLPIDHDLKKKGLCLVPLSMLANYLEQ